MNDWITEHPDLWVGTFLGILVLIFFLAVKLQKKSSDTEIHRSKPPVPADPFETIMDSLRHYLAGQRKDLEIAGDLLLGTHMGILLVTDNDMNRDQIFSDKPFLDALGQYAKKQCVSMGIYLECIAVTSQESIENAADDSWMVTWRSGWCPRIAFDVPQKSLPSMRGATPTGKP